MQQPIKAILFLFSVTLAFCQTRQTGRAEPVAKSSRASAAAARTRELMELVQQPIDMKDFQQPMKLKEALGLFYDKFDGLGKALPILIDTAAFKEEDPNADDIRETDLQFPDYPRKMPFVAALRLALYQVQSKAGATFLIRPGMYVEITTLKRASAENLVKQKVLIDFRKRPVAEVLEELADLTSTTVILDERVGKKADTPITAIFRNEITLADALTLVTDMADLKVVYLDSAVYVTTPENARRIQQEMRESREKPRKVTDPVRKRGS